MKHSKPYWEMASSELRKATQQFDDPFYQPPALAQTGDDIARQRRAKNEGGRPRKGLGAKTISLTVEKALLARSDAYTRSGLASAVRNLCNADSMRSCRCGDQAGRRDADLPIYAYRV
jgi:hypothetical protein